jgi:RNA polymerase sigma-54 factor
MALSPRIELRQHQTLVMTPQLQQALRLLQMSNVELMAYVAGEVESNPVLDLGEPAPASAGVSRPASGAVQDGDDAVQRIAAETTL